MTASTGLKVSAVLIVKVLKLFIVEEFIKSLPSVEELIHAIIVDGVSAAVIFLVLYSFGFLFRSIIPKKQ